MTDTTSTQKKNRGQWTAQFLAAAELSRRWYTVAFTMGNHTPEADLIVAPLAGKNPFLVQVKGVSTDNSWNVTQKASNPSLFYILVRVGAAVGADRYFILSQAEIDALIKPGKAPGFSWKACHPYENKWETLPQSN
jgi:hypothetical protein